MKYQSLFSGKNKKNIASLSSAKLAKRMVKVNVLITTAADGIFICFLFFIFFFLNKTCHFMYIIKPYFLRKKKIIIITNIECLLQFCLVL